MKIKRNRLRQCYHRTAIPKKDREGNSYLEYNPASTIMAEVWPAGGKIQAEIYGQRLAYIRNCRIQGDYFEFTNCAGYMGYQVGDVLIKEGDGICLNVPANADPDYRIISIRPYRVLTLELEKIR